MPDVSGLWAMPAPFDFAAVAVVYVLWAAWKLFERINLNLLELGWPWVVTYWFSYIAAVSLASWGRERIGRTLAGNDVLEVRFAAWLGKPAAFMLKAYVAVPAWAATVAVIVGYGTVTVMLIVGILWRWCAVLVGGWVLLKAAELRRARLRKLR